MSKNTPKVRPRRVYFDIKKKTPYIVKNGKRVFIRLKKDGGGNTTIDHRTIKDKRQIVKVIVNTTKPHEVKSKPRRKRRIILAKKEEQTTRAGNERTIYVPQYMPFPGHSQQPITVNIREGGKDKEKSVIPTPVKVNEPKGVEDKPIGSEARPEGVETQTQTEETEVESPETPVKSGPTEGAKSETPIKPGGRPVSDYNIEKSNNIELLKHFIELLEFKIPESMDYDNIDDLKTFLNSQFRGPKGGKMEPAKIKKLIEEREMGRLEDIRKKQEGMGHYTHAGKTGGPVGKGLTTKEINKLMKDEGYDIVKAIPSDCIPELVNDVNKKTEKFGFIINNEPHTKAGEHWRACFIDISEGNVCWFDSLCGEPTRKEMKGIKVLIDKINPEYYLKFKINRIKLQGDTTNCGWFACKFIDDMMSGKKFKEATGWDVVNGECGIENYKEKHGCMPERWGCI